MELVWQTNAWEDYLYWQEHDKKILRRINELIKESLRNPFKGIGKPEPLKGNLAGCRSRRITDEHRLVYALKINGCIFFNVVFTMINALINEYFHDQPTSFTSVPIPSMEIFISSLLFKVKSCSGTMPVPVMIKQP